MKNPAIRDRLRDIVAYGREAIEAAADLTPEQIAAERFREHALLRTVQIVGEAAAQVMKLDPGLLSRVTDLRRSTDLRNLLVHGYGKIRLNEVVRIVRDDLPRLIADADAVLKDDYA